MPEMLDLQPIWNPDSGREPQPAADAAAPDETAALDAYSRVVTGVAERAAPGVVAIAIAERTDERGRAVPGGGGSGFVFTPDGLVLTNAHVVAGGRGIEVLTTSGLRLDADVLGVDPHTDIALLRVAGVNTAIIAAAQGICFSVSIDIARQVVPELMRHGRVRRASLGISGQNLRLPRRYVRYFELSIESAVRVMEIAKGSPADQAGVQAGDILIRFGEHDVDGIDALHRILGADRIGSEAAISVLRRDRRLELSLVPTELAAG